MPNINTKHAYPVALITGASQRIGKAISESLHEMNYCVIIHFHQNEQLAQALATDLNQKRAHSAVAIKADLRKSDELNHLVKMAQAHWGRVDVLINNASIFEPDNTVHHETPTNQTIINQTKQWQHIIDTNIRSAWLLSNALHPSLNEHDGCIINLVDIYANRPLKSHSIYSISKAGISMMSQSLALEFAPTVRVNGISPGAILWPSSEKEASDSQKTHQQEILNKIPLAKLGSTKAITKAVHFLIECDYITGQIINVDGGRSITI